MKKHKKLLDTPQTPGILPLAMSNKYYVRNLGVVHDYHQTLEKATKQAELLSVQNPGATYGILQVVGETVTPHATPITTIFAEETKAMIEKMIALMDLDPVFKREYELGMTAEQLLRCMKIQIEYEKGNGRIPIRFELTYEEFDLCFGHPEVVGRATVEGIPVTIGCSGYKCVTKPSDETQRQELVKKIDACIEEANRKNHRIARFELDGKQFRLLDSQDSPHSLSGTYMGYAVVMAMKFACITEPKHDFKVGDSVVARTAPYAKLVGSIRQISEGLSPSICVDYGSYDAYYYPEELAHWNP